MMPNLIDTVNATDKEILAEIYKYIFWYGMTIHAILLFTLLFIGIKWIIPIWWYKK